MIDLQFLSKGLQLTREELAEVCKNAGISRVRVTLAERRLVRLTPSEEARLRLAINYALHRRQAKLLRNVGQGHFDNTQPVAWDEYKRLHQEPRMPKEMRVMTIAIELTESDGQLMFPLSEPLPWNIELNTEAAKVLASFPEVLESMLNAIRTVVAQNQHGG